MTSHKLSGQGLLWYRLDARTGQWVCETDGHFLVELLARDLIHLCKGVPSF